MFYQLNPTLPVTYNGQKAYAIAVIDYGQEHHLMWVCVADETGEIWTVENKLIRVQGNWTMSAPRNKVDK